MYRTFNDPIKQLLDSFWKICSFEKIAIAIANEKLIEMDWKFSFPFQHNDYSVCCVVANFGNKVWILVFLAWNVKVNIILPIFIVLHNHTMIPYLWVFQLFILHKSQVSG